MLSLLVWALIVSRGSSKLRVEADNIQISEVQNDNFLEYVDVEGLVQPIMTIKVNTQEAGSVQKIVSEEGNMLQKGDTYLC